MLFAYSYPFLSCASLPTLNDIFFLSSSYFLTASVHRHVLHQNALYKALPATPCGLALATVCSVHFGWWSGLFQPSLSKMELQLCSAEPSVTFRPRGSNLTSIIAIFFKLVGLKIVTVFMIYSLFFNTGF